MRIYISHPSGQASNLPRQLQRIARLYRCGVLDNDSTVWVNTNVIAPLFWTLSGRSACMYWFDAPASGTVRLTKDRIRWATTYNATNSNPDLEVKLSALNLDSMKHVTFVVDHGQSDEPVQVIEGSETRKMTNGFYEGVHASVIDLPAFVRSEADVSGTAAPFAAASALVHGAALLTAGMPRSVQATFEADMENYGRDLDGATLDILVGSIETFETVSNIMLGKPATS